MTAMTTHRVPVEDVELEVFERGHGEAVLLVHAGVFGGWFAPLFEAAELDGCRVIRPIRAGYGASTTAATHLTLADHARHCGGVLDALGVDAAHWVGHSSSCCMGLQLALDQPERVRSLTLLEPARPLGPMAREASPRYVGAALAAFSAGDLDGAFAAMLNGVVGPQHREMIERTLGAEGLARAVQDSAYFFADEMPALKEWSFGPVDAALVTAPTVLVYGSATRPWFRENAELLCRLVPGARTVELAGLDHAAPLTGPSAVAAAVAAVIAESARS